jgi:hypothetical protein
VKQYSDEIFLLLNHCMQTPKLAQICVHIIKTNLVETVVFRKMQSSFALNLILYNIITQYETAVAATCIYGSYIYI